MSPSNEDLLAGAGRGDEASFLGLYDRLAPRVLGFIARFVHDREECEDILQEVMWEAWRRSSGFNPELSSASTWLLMIARARAIDAIRSRGRRAAVAAGGGESAVPNAEPLPDWEVVGESSRRALRSLPPEQLEVVMLAYARGLSRDTIADILGIPVGTVKTRIRAAVGRMRESLEEPARA